MINELKKSEVGLFHDPVAEPERAPLTAGQIARALAWVKAHYVSGTFSCPEGH